jgi:hypothetical protein
MKYNKYLGFDNVYLPLSNYKDLYKIYSATKSKKIVETNKFFIAKVIEGNLDIIKEV